MNHVELGRWGEAKAEEYLRKKGYQLVEKNYRAPLGEIDLIFIKDKYLVFVEVKTRREQDFGPPELAVNYPKRQQLQKLALYYWKNSNYQHLQIRFDVIAITVSNGRGHLKHFRNAF